MRSFSSYILSDSYLAERALDVELGEAGEKFWALVSKEVVAVMDARLKVLGDIFQEGGNTFKEFDAIYPWSSKTSTALPEPTWGKWDSEVESILNRLYVGNAAAVISSTAEIPDSIVVQLGMTDKYTVVPKSLKKDFERHEFGKQMFVTVGAGSIVSLDPKDKGTAGGYYRSLRTAPPSGMSGKSSYSHIVVAGVSSLKRKSVRDIVYTIYRFRMNPNKRKAAVAEWIAKLSSDLKSRTKTGIHEYIHFLDAVRYKTAVDKSPNSWSIGAKAGWGEDMPTYYKSSHEWQAHFQDTATRLRRNLRSFLDAMVNKGVVAAIIAIGGSGLGTGSEKDKIDRWNGWNEHVGTGFDAGKRGAAIAAFIDGELNRILPRLFEEVEWKFGFKSKEWIDLNNLKRDRFTALAYAYMSKYSHGWHEWMKDDEMRKRFLKRIASLADDLRKITDDFYAELRSGKSPSKQRWNQAMDNIHHEAYLYVGSLMRSKATDVYDVRLFFYQYEMP